MRDNGLKGKEKEEVFGYIQMEKRKFRSGRMIEKSRNEVDCKVVLNVILYIYLFLIVACRENSFY